MVKLCTKAYLSAGLIPSQCSGLSPNWPMKQEESLRKVSGERYCNLVVIWLRFMVIERITSADTAQQQVCSILTSVE